MSAEIVPLYPERDLTDEDAPVTRDRGELLAKCLHHYVRIDQDAHKLYCRSCDVECDPITFLTYLASNWERYASHRKEADRRATAAHKRLKEVLRLEKNARSRLKKLDPGAEWKSPQKPWGDGTVGW